MLLDPDDWSGTSIGSIPIGQGISVTAMQMLFAYNVIANDGVYVPPTLVRGHARRRGRAPPGGARRMRRRVVSPTTAAQLRAMLAEVIDHGTGKAAAIDGYDAAGKTGTARKPQPGGGYRDAAGQLPLHLDLRRVPPGRRPQAVDHRRHRRAHDVAVRRARGGAGLRRASAATRCAPWASRRPPAAAAGRPLPPRRRPGAGRRPRPPTTTTTAAATTTVPGRDLARQRRRPSPALPGAQPATTTATACSRPGAKAASALPPCCSAPLIAAYPDARRRWRRPRPRRARRGARHACRGPGRRCSAACGARGSTATTSPAVPSPRVRRRCWSTTSCRWRCPSSSCDDVRGRPGPGRRRVLGPPSRDLAVVGVTGTSGKTTVTHLLCPVFAAAGPRRAASSARCRVPARRPRPPSCRPCWPQRDSGAGGRGRRRRRGMEVSSHGLDPAPGRRHPLRRRSVHQPVAGPPRLPRHDG